MTKLFLLQIFTTVLDYKYCLEILDEYLITLVIKRNEVKMKKRVLRHDSRKMEDFSVQVREVGHDEDEQGFEDSCVIGEPCDEADDVTPDDADDRAAAGDDDEGGEAFEDVGHL